MRSAFLNGSDLGIQNSVICKDLKILIFSHRVRNHKKLL